MTSEPTTRPMPTLQAVTAPRGRRESIRSAALAASAVRDRTRRGGAPVTVGGIVTIVLLATTALVLLRTLPTAGSARMAVAGNALLVVAIATVLVVAILIGGIRRLLRDRALRRRFPEAVVVTVGHGTAPTAGSLVFDGDRVSLWTGLGQGAPARTWERDVVTRALALRHRRALRHTADLVLVADGHDVVFRPFRSAGSFAQRMHRDAVETLAGAVPTARRVSDAPVGGRPLGG